MAVLLCAAAGGGHGEQLLARTYGQTEGLGNLTVQALAQDASGFLWIGTENGLFRFDGASFVRLGQDVAVADVSALAVDGGGRVWIGTTNGLYAWQRDHLQPVTNKGLAIRVTLPQPFAIDASGHLFVVSEGRLLMVDPKAGQEGFDVRDAIDPDVERRDPSLRQLSSAFAGRDGALWLGCDKELCKRGSAGIEHWNSGRGVEADRWFGMLMDRRGAVWARGAKRLVELPPGGQRFVARGDPALAAGALALPEALVEDAQGRILTSNVNVLARWDGHAWQRFGAASGLTGDNRLRALLLDREGELWAGRSGAGLLQWSGYGRWENWTSADGLPSEITWAIARDEQQRLAVGTNRGAVPLDLAKRPSGHAQSTGHPTRMAAVSSFETDSRGKLWAGTFSGRISPWWEGAGARTAPGVGGLPAIYAMRRRTDGSMWIGTEGGLFIWDPTRPADAPAAVQQALLGKLSILDLCEDMHGTSWLASDGGLLSNIRGAWSVAAPENQGTIDTLACLRDGTIAFAGEAGGLKIARRHGDAITAEDRTPEILRGRRAMAMHEDSRGWLWITTDGGVAVRNGARWRFVDQRDGLAWNDASHNALFEDQDGSIWIGTSRGVSHMVAPESLFASRENAAQILSAKYGERSFALDRPATMPWRRDALEFVIAMPTFRERAALSLEYRLAGYGDQWMTAPHTDIQFVGLQPGSYRFQIRVRDREREIISRTIDWAFEIEPPWWATPPMRVATGVLLLLAAGVAYRWRMRGAIRRARRLESLVQERTQELEQEREKFRVLATRDGLTGAMNRGAILEVLDAELVRARRESFVVIVVMADIDHFKRVNDTHGHAGGDAVLRQFVQRLASTIRPYDAIGRYGGEEFLLVLPGQPGSRAREVSLVARIHAAISTQPMQLDAQTALAVTCSFGAAFALPGEAASAAAILERADQALYRAKRAGRDRVEFATG